MTLQWVESSRYLEAMSLDRLYTHDTVRSDEVWTSTSRHGKYVARASRQTWYGRGDMIDVHLVTGQFMRY